MARRSRMNRRTSKRAPLRKFVWARTVGTLSGPDTVGVDLLEDFQSEYGAQLLGATVMRIRGYIVPDMGLIEPGNRVGGHFGFIVEQDQELADQAIENLPISRPHDDWLGWLPWQLRGATAGWIS